MRVFLLILGCLSFIPGLSQTITIKKVELAGENIIVHYDLDDSNPNNEYKLELYGSNDNFISPLKNVKGDIGPEVIPGVNKTVEWNIRKEYGNYKGRVALEVKGKVYIPFVKLQNFNTEKKYKRGTSINLGWKPGSPNPVNIELYKSGQRVHGDNGLPNNGSHTLYIPSNTKRGSDYRLKITDARNSEDVLYTNDFTVKPKVPLLLKLFPILAIGGAVATLTGGDGPAGKPSEQTLPDPDFPNN